MVSAGLAEFARESPAIPLRRPDEQAAMNHDPGNYGSPFVQTESADDFGGDSKGETVSP